MLPSWLKTEKKTLPRQICSVSNLNLPLIVLSFGSKEIEKCQKLPNNKDLKLPKITLKKHVVFAIFRYKVELIKAGSSTSVSRIFVFREYFLENIFNAKDLCKMGIVDFEIYFNKVKKIVDNVNYFCLSIENENRISIIEGKPDPELDEIIKKLKQIKTSKNKKNDKEATKQKAIGFLYQESIKFLPNDKIFSDFPMSDKFLQNLFFIHTNQITVHHSHVTGKIIGYAHEYCNFQIR